MDQLIRALVVDDEPHNRKELKHLLGNFPHLQVIEEAESGETAIMKTIQHQPDVVFLDVEMPKKSGLDVLEWVRKNKEMKVIIVTTFKRVGYFERAVKAGVDAYVLKDRSTSELMSTIHTVLAGKKEYSPELMESMISQDNPLSPQEKRILQLISLGKSNQDIADTLYLSNGTVRNYTSSIFNKLSANNRTEAVRIAEDNGWL